MEAALIGSHLHIHINRMNALAPVDNFARISRLSNCQAIPKRLEIAGRVDLVLCRTHGTYVVATCIRQLGGCKNRPGMAPSATHARSCMALMLDESTNTHPRLPLTAGQLSQGISIRPSDRLLSAYNRCREFKR